MEEPATAEPTPPIVEEPPTAWPTSPSSGAHDKGDPGDEEVWIAMIVSADAARVGVETVGGVPSGTMQSPPTVVKTMTSTVASTVEVGLERLIRTQW